MNEKLNEIIGYHGTCSKWYDSIREVGLDPKKVKYRDDHWLGQGVYFFTELDKALWWANDQANKPWNNGTYPIAYRTEILAKEEEILNLDNQNQLDKFFDQILESIDSIEKSGSEKHPVFANQSQYRALYFDYYKEQNNISVIIYTFKKPFAKYAKIRTKEEVERLKSLSKILGVEYSETQICVSKKGCIGNTELVYNGECEVI